MPRGRPDYNVGDLEIAESLDNKDSIIVSKKMINTVDGLGRLYYFDTFQNGIQSWVLQSFGDGAIPVQKYGSGEVGDVGVYMYGGTNNGVSYSHMSRTFRFDGGVSIAVEVGVSHLPSRGNFSLLVNFRSRGSFLQGGVKVLSTGVVQLLRSDNTYEAIDTLISSGNGGNWMPVKLGLNVSSLDYGRVIVGQNRYSHDNITPRDLSPSTISELSVTLQTISNGAVANSENIGHVIITTDEP